MTERLENVYSNPISLATLGWEDGSAFVMCQNCNWRFLGSEGKIPQECPHCHAAPLQHYQGSDFSMLVDFIKPPELYVPFSYPGASLIEKMRGFMKNIPFAPDDLNLENLQQRLRKIYLPLWLEDSQVSGSWQAECGYHYQVKSHQEKYNAAGWQTQEVIETRTRWEPRLGRLERSYENIVAPALEEHRPLMSALGNFEFKQVEPTSTEKLFEDTSHLASLVCIPSRDKDDAWPDALPRFQEQASAEARQACGADQIREFNWKPEFENQNWTLFLLPMWTSYYLDDENKPQSILVNGQSGQMSGARRSSMHKAKKVALTILMIALVGLALSVALGLIALTMPALMLFAGIGLVISLIIALAAIYPIATVWNVNRQR
jgi:hypothetical protein